MAFFEATVYRNVSYSGGHSYLKRVTRGSLALKFFVACGHL